MRTALTALLASFCITLSAAADKSAASPSAPPPAATLIVLDASGSMRELIGGESKMDIAKRAVGELVAGLPDEAQLGLVVYSHRKPQDCEDIELLLPPAKLDRKAFVATVNAIKPKGRTPLASALEFAAAKLEYTKQPASIILVTDGLETCGRNPCETAARLKAAGMSFVVHAVAFDLSSRDAKSIACIANATGGRFLQAKDAASLRDALAVVAAETVATPSVPTPPKPVNAEPAPAPKIAPPPPAVTLKAPDAVDAGAALSVLWTGPDASGDFVTIVPKGASDDEDGNLAYTRRGSPLALSAPVDAGDAEIRYISGSDHTVLARRALRVLPVEIKLEAPSEVVAGAEARVTWKGPAYSGDYVVIVPADPAIETDSRPAAVYQVPSVVVTAPMYVGAAEVRLQSGQNRKILGRCPIRIVAANVSLDTPAEVVAGSVVRVVWKGPNNENDSVSIVPLNHADEARDNSASTMGGSPAQVQAPNFVGDCEVRYVSGQDHKVLARRPILTLPAAATLSAPAKTMAGSAVSVAWTGPDNPNDFLTLVRKSVGDTEYAEKVSTMGGSPLVLRAPAESGPAEVRYMDGTDYHVIARREIAVLAPRATLRAPARVPASSVLQVAWTGPDGENDFLTIVPAGSSDDTIGVRAWTMSGSPLEIETSAEPGAYEIRYIVFRDSSVLQRMPLEIGPAGSAILERTEDASAVPTSAASGAAAKPAEPPTVGHGERVDVAAHLVPGRTTVFVLTSPYSTFSAKFDDECRQLHAQRDDVAVVFIDINRPSIRWLDGESPASVQFDVKKRGIPSVILYDAAGQPMPEEMNEQATIWRWLHVRGH